MRNRWPDVFRTRASLLVLPLIMIAGCQSCPPRPSKLIVIEYDHRLSFQKYELAVLLPAHNNQNNLKLLDPVGDYLVFHICSIENDDVDAETFQFELSKFYVVHNDQEFKPKPFSSNEVVDPWFNAAELQQWNDQFDKEIRTAPKSTTIQPGSISFGNSWRFAIRVDPMVPDGFSPDLRYDNSQYGEQMLITDRGHAPQELIKASDYYLHDQCRD